MTPGSKDRWTQDEDTIIQGWKSSERLADIAARLAAIGRVRTPGAIKKRARTLGASNAFGSLETCSVCGSQFRIHRGRRGKLRLCGKTECRRQYERTYNASRGPERKRSSTSHPGRGVPQETIDALEAHHRGDDSLLDALLADGEDLYCHRCDSDQHATRDCPYSDSQLKHEFAAEHEWERGERLRNGE